MILEPFTATAHGHPARWPKMTITTPCRVRRHPDLGLTLAFTCPDQAAGEVFWDHIDIFDATNAHIMTVNIERHMGPGDRFDITLGVTG
jgi:hypothetical protein